MSTLDEITAFLHPRVGAGPQVIDTHISRVVIGAERAFKIKKPVAFSYLDFSTREKRAAAAESELALNRRTAPSLFLGLRRVTRETNGALALDGSGEPLETIVEMKSFGQEDLFDAMAQRGALTPDLMTRLTEKIVAFHSGAPPSYEFGGGEGMTRVIDIDAPALAASGLATPARRAALDRALRERLAALAPLLDARRAGGKVRRCHGDLTLRNICLFEGEPTPFDCIEFDDSLGVIDVLYDLAFLLMDLVHRSRADLANLVFNRYLDIADETDGLPALPFLMAVRASIRAHVTATQARNVAEKDAAGMRAEAEAYFALAEKLLAPCANMLVAIGGFSGSGKSTLAARLAPHLGPAPGARILSSDRIRKQMHGARPLERLPPQAYAPHVSERVYALMRESAGRVLALGHSVVADAVFDRPTLAKAIEDAAHQAGRPFAGIWLAGERDALAARIAARRNDPSDATVEVLGIQFARGEAASGWRKVDADGPVDQLAQRALDLLPPATIRT